MSNLSKSISAVCHQIIENPTITNLRTHKEYAEALERLKIRKTSIKMLGGSENYTNGDRSIVYNTDEYRFYENVKNNICIKLFKELSTEPSFNDMDEQVYKMLHQEAQVVKNGSRDHVAMQAGDIEIKFSNTPLSKQISESEFMQKNGAIIKGENCFIERVSPGGKDGERYALIQATQEDLKAILVGLTELL